MIATKNAVWLDLETNLEHRVLEVSSDGVITWSNPAPNANECEMIAGYSFMGPPEQFYKQFQFRRAA